MTKLFKEAYLYCGKLWKLRTLWSFENSGENFSRLVDYRSMTKFLDNIPNPEVRKAIWF